MVGLAGGVSLSEYFQDIHYLCEHELPAVFQQG
jgi:hypothetical protein